MSVMEENEGPVQKQGNSGETALKCRLYKLLLEKYAELINDGEKRTIGEIKALVDAEDLTIQSILGDLKPSDYSFESKYEEAAEKAFKFVTTEIAFVDPEINVNYWLSPTEIFSAKVADDEDLAVFLSTILLALKDKKAAIIICELENLKTHAVVTTELNGKFLLLDPSQKHEFKQFHGEMEEILGRYKFQGAKIKRFLYKFNSEVYEQFM